MRPVTRVQTTWLPRSEVRRVITREEPGVVTSMEALSELADGAAVRAAMGRLVEAYGGWIEEQLQIDPGTDARRQTRDALMKQAALAKARIAEGIELLASDPEVLDAFRMANRAMATAALRRNPERYSDEKRPAWRLFQLAFVVLNLAGAAREDHRDRETVERIFFPTGGGKTEAYLGLIAFTLLLRRLRGQARPDKGLGVAVLLRYTLRLLTLDQLGRAATLICALERIRLEQPAKLGDVRFAVGLWVGRSATANTLDEVSKKITDYKNAASKKAPSPFPLTHCPWCGKELGRDALTVTRGRSGPSDVMVGCEDFPGDFSRGRNREGLPVLFVDEQIYRELGGMRRLVEDEIRSRCSTWADRLPKSFLHGPNPFFENRLIQMEPVELTSREHTGNIADAKARLAKPYADKDHVDVLLASNMISVGVDIDRLGLMVVAGQPKTTSEYIQATSRVGRQRRWPGLVVTCFNLHKPRDRSHYERFVTYHESFYRWVEAQSLTPFSGPALERGLAGTLVSMVRLADPRMTEPAAAMMIDKHRADAERWVGLLAARGGL